MSIGGAPLCSFCQRFIRNQDTLVCSAYPEGIPEEIIESQVDHRDPVEGDHGLMFVPMSREGIEYADFLFDEV